MGAGRSGSLTGLRESAKLRRKYLSHELSSGKPFEKHRPGIALSDGRRGQRFHALRYLFHGFPHLRV